MKINKKREKEANKQHLKSLKEANKNIKQMIKDAKDKQNG